MPIFKKLGFCRCKHHSLPRATVKEQENSFHVTTLDLDNISELPRDEENDNQVDYTEDFFGKPSFLTVSVQLGPRHMLCPLGDVYTFGPTFRAENSQTI